MFADQFTGQLEDKYRIPRVEFPQTIVNFSGPTTEYERLIVAGEMLHNRNPVFTWQAGHVKVKADAHKNIRPLKQARGDYRTIDGIVAAIMALARCLEAKPIPEPGVAVF